MQKRERKKRTSRDYSVAFKLQVVEEIKRGELNYDQAGRKYGIQGNATVSRWMRKFGSLDKRQLKLSIVASKQTPEQRIKELEQLLALEREKLYLEKEKVQVLNIAIDIADQTLNTDIRKKYLPELLKKQKPSR